MCGIGGIPNFKGSFGDLGLRRYTSQIASRTEHECLHAVSGNVMPFMSRTKGRIEDTMTTISRVVVNA